jgi:hypothetical protein
VAHDGAALALSLELLLTYTLRLSLTYALTYTLALSLAVSLAYKLRLTRREHVGVHSNVHSDVHAGTVTDAHTLALRLRLSLWLTMGLSLAHTLPLIYHSQGLRLETFSKEHAHVFTVVNRAESDDNNDIKLMTITLVESIEIVVKVDRILVYPGLILRALQFCRHVLVDV